MEIYIYILLGIFFGITVALFFVLIRNNNKKNINNIWRLCKYYLMLEGFKESFVSLKNQDTKKESFNNLSN